MKKLFLFACGLLLSWNAGALDLADIHLADKVQLGDASLRLNGGGIRTKFFFKIYVGSLYLPQQESSAEAIIADDRPYRMAMYIKHGLSSEKLYNSFHEAMEDNHTPEQMSAMSGQIDQLKGIFESVHEVKPGDIVTLDYLPASGIAVTVNGTQRGIIAGAAFSRALLRIWLGDHPVQDDLKKGLLGG